MNFKFCLFIFVVSFIIFSIPINSFPLRNWDEAWYGEIIKNMASGNYSWLVPYWNGQYYFDKPLLYFWLSFPIVKLFGIGEWQIRLVSVVASSFSVLLVYLVSKLLFEQSEKSDSPRSPQTISYIGIFSTILFLSLGQVYIRFSHGNLDALLITLFLATYYFWLSSEKNSKWAWVSGLTLGFSFLVKGWTLGLFPLFVIGVHSFVCERKIIPKNLIYIIVGAILASSWWYILGSLKFGSVFFNWYILTFAEGNFRGISFSLPPFVYLLRDVGAWWLVILFSLCSIDSNHWNKKQLLFYLCIIVLFLFALGFSKEQLDWHNLSIYPFVPIIVGLCIYNLYKRYGKIILVTFCLLLVIQVVVAYKIENLYPDRSDVGAKLGVFAKQILKQEDIVILDDHDFTSFLYYSNHKKVYMLSSEEIKSGEFWRLKYENLSSFIKTYENVILISQHPEVFQENGQIIATFNNYKFLKLN